MTRSDDTELAKRIAKSVKKQVESDEDSRRGFLSRTALAGGTLLALGGSAGFAFAEDHEEDGPTVEGPTPEDMQAMFNDVDGTDLDVVNYALTLEKLETEFYRQGFEAFDETDFSEADAFEDYDDDERQAAIETLQTFGAQEAAHVGVLSDVVELLGGEPALEETDTPMGNATDTPMDNGTDTPMDNGTDVSTVTGTSPMPGVTFDFGVESVDEMLAVAQVVETTGVAAYAGAAPFIESPDLLSAALSIHSVEARHAAYLNHLLGDEPAPDAFDPAQSQDDVLAAIGPFIVDPSGDMTDTSGNATDTSGNTTDT